MMLHQSKILNHEASSRWRPCSSFYWLQPSGEIEKRIRPIVILELTT